MNRRQRRAARHQSHHAGGRAAPAASADFTAPIVKLFAAAVRQHQVGQFAEAGKLYRKILAAEPDHIDSLQNLGAIAHQVGRHEMAIDLIGKALAQNDRNPSGHYNIALAYRALGRLEQALAHARSAIALAPDHIGAHLVIGDICEKQGKLDEAKECYERARALDPDRAAAYNSLGNVLVAQDRPEEARASFERALALDPHLAVAHINLGNLHRAQGRLEQAIDSYLQAIEIKPDDMDAHNNFCAMLMAQGKFGAAAAHYEQILAFRPDYVQGYNNLAMAYHGAGEPLRALDAVQRALKISQLPESKSLWVLCVRSLQSAPVSDDMRELTVRAMSEPWGRPGDLARHCVNLLRADRNIADCITRAAAAWPARLPAAQLFGQTGFRALSRDLILRCLLENARVSDVALERCLTNIRLALLEAAMVASGEEELEDGVLGFYCALARQCFINEYIFALTDEEYAQFGSLREKLTAALRAKAPVPALWLVAVAAYMPLHALAESDNLLSRAWPDPIKALLAQQVREPMEESRLRNMVPRLTQIEDDVSLLVQHQYEENPYPRWVKAAPVSEVNSIDARLRGQFPFAGFRNIGKTSAIDVLVAGCGTGQQLVDVAQRIAGARVLAIDLSRASLSYAMRQTRALGLDNIEYGQADILKLGSLGRSFDVIDCGGVLHHLGDPMAGWRVLLSLLRPNGVMRIALYSELARRHVVAARTFVAEHGYGRGADDIRRFRQDVLALADGDLVKTVAQSPDFFSVSDCRDLVFHVQEHRFTLPQIQAFLAASDVTFLGFEIDIGVLRQYDARFPDDRARTALDRWHSFEQDNPGTFGGMYQFWVQKAG